MLFMEEHAQAVLSAIQARRDPCDAVLGCMSEPNIVKLTRIGRFNMDGSKRGALDFLKRLRGGGKPSDTGGAQQLAMLRRIPRILRFIPGPAQDLRAYFLTLQYWLAGSDENIANLVRFLRTATRAEPISPARQAEGASADRIPGRRALPPSRDWAARRFVDRSAASIRRLARHGRPLADAFLHPGEQHRALRRGDRGLEARGLRTIPAFASGLDARPAVEAYFKSRERKIDALVSLTGFSLVGGPAYNDFEQRGENAGRARCALYRRSCARIPDDRGMGELRSAGFRRSRRR